MNETEMSHVRAVKATYESELLEKANVVGVGIGLGRRGGELTDEPAIVVSVTRKVPLEELDPQDVIPRELDGVQVQVQAVGMLRAL